MREALGRAAVLGVPARARVYDAVAAAYPGWVSRDEAARAAGIGRGLAAFHLERLAEAGLLEAGARRLTGRTGPGAGRPARVYRRALAAVEVSIPPRNYELPAELLLRAFERAPATAAARAALLEAAAAAGRAAASDDILDALRRIGYEPAERDSAIRLRNCPFDALAERHRELVCDMNRALLGGLVERSPYRAELRPEPGYCCVALTREPAP